MQIFNNTLVLRSLSHFLRRETITKKTTKETYTSGPIIPLFFTSALSECAVQYEYKGTKIPSIQSKTIGHVSRYAVMKWTLICLVFWGRCLHIILILFSKQIHGDWVFSDFFFFFAAHIRCIGIGYWLSMQKRERSKWVSL